MKVEASDYSGGTITIANNETDSEAIPFQAGAQCGFILPAAFTGASVSFKVSVDGSNYFALYDSSNALISVTVTQGRAYSFPIALFPWPFVKLVSASAEGAEREIKIAMKY